MEGIAVWREAEPRQEPPGAKPMLQNTPQDCAAQVKITPGRKTGMVTGHGGQVQPQDRDIAFSLASQMNSLQASSRLFLHSVPTSTWVMLEYNTQRSAQVNSEFVWISESRRNCTGCGWCRVRRTKRVYPYLIPRNKSRVVWWVRGLPPRTDMKHVDSWTECHSAVVKHSARVGWDAEQIDVLVLRPEGKSRQAMFNTSVASIWGELHSIRRWGGGQCLLIKVLLATGSWTSQILAQSWSDNFYLVFMLSSALSGSVKRCTQQTLTRCRNTH